MNVESMSSEELQKKMIALDDERSGITELLNDSGEGINKCREFINKLMAGDDPVTDMSKYYVLDYYTECRKDLFTRFMNVQIELDILYNEYAKSNSKILVPSKPEELNVDIVVEKPKALEVKSKEIDNFDKVVILVNNNIHLKGYDICAEYNLIRSHRVFNTIDNIYDYLNSTLSSCVNGVMLTYSDLVDVKNILPTYNIRGYIIDTEGDLIGLDLYMDSIGKLKVIKEDSDVPVAVKESSDKDAVCNKPILVVKNSTNIAELHTDDIDGDVYMMSGYYDNIDLLGELIKDFIIRAPNQCLVVRYEFNDDWVEVKALVEKYTNMGSILDVDVTIKHISELVKQQQTLSGQRESVE